jgi:hypothetical protein
MAARILAHASDDLENGADLLWRLAALADLCDRAPGAGLRSGFR